MSSFLDKLWVDYPIPKEASIWSDTEDSPAVENLETLIEACVNELGSDLFVIQHKQVSGMTTKMPDDTVHVICAKLSQPFQGNRQIKFSYDKGTNLVHLRYWPATISYRRKLRIEDLENLVGDELRYAKLYVLWRMSYKELQVLKAVKLNADNGEIDLSEIQEFSKDCRDQYIEMKKEILIYGTNN